MVDSIYRTRSLGVAAEGLPDQYADGKAAQVWEYYIGNRQSRTEKYRKWLTTMLKDNNCSTILDVACGTGVDSILLVEEGFKVVSTDASDKMLKHALKDRWNRRKDEKFDNWVIEEANWLTLDSDLENVAEVPKGGFDAVICLGNSFAHLPDFDGDLGKQKTAITNFKNALKPGGILLIDHRNYDEILATGKVPVKNVYYNSVCMDEIKCSNLYVNGEPNLTTLDYIMDMTKVEGIPIEGKHHFRLSYYPYRLEKFTALVKGIFGDEAHHCVYADFEPVNKCQSIPAYYLHVARKPKTE